RRIVLRRGTLAVTACADGAEPTPGLTTYLLSAAAHRPPPLALGRRGPLLPCRRVPHHRFLALRSPLRRRRPRPCRPFSRRPPLPASARTPSASTSWTPN